jgi:hypothetical protein
MSHTIHIFLLGLSAGFAALIARAIIVGFLQMRWR